jgi:hypothetical protein
MSIARLWRDRGKRSEARDLLAPIYGWFTEGFNSRSCKTPRRCSISWCDVSLMALGLVRKARRALVGLRLGRHWQGASTKP